MLIKIFVISCYVCDMENQRTNLDNLRSDIFSCFNQKELKALYPIVAVAWVYSQEARQNNYLRDKLVKELHKIISYMESNQLTHFLPYKTLKDNVEYVATINYCDMDNSNIIGIVAADIKVFL